MPDIIRSGPGYDPAAVGIGIVHVGLGAFHRAHQAVYVDRWLARGESGDWGICAANIRSNHRIVTALREQNWRYHVAQFADRQHVELREIASIRKALFAGADKSGLLGQLAHPSTRIVSLTVSEKAYYLSPATGALQREHPDIVQDLATPAQPRTAPGLLLEALRLRKAAGLAPFTVLCCDNMPENGARTRRSVIELAAPQSPELADWIAGSVPFPSTMVDRIVPAVTDAKRSELNALIGVPDAAAVACESFSQWVIEDRFALGRPDWETVGVEMVDDVSPYETMKLRMLNGAHSLLAYVGLARGRATVAEAVADADLRTLVRAYFDEAAASLAPHAGIDPGQYAESLLARFSNDALEHKLTQIAMDGSQKLPQRWLEGAMDNLANGRPLTATVTGVAAWIAYVRGRDDAGACWTVDDPLAVSLARCHRQHSSVADIVGATLGVADVFPASLAASEVFRTGVCRAYESMLEGPERAG